MSSLKWIIKPPIFSSLLLFSLYTIFPAGVSYATPTPPPCSVEMVAYWRADSDASDYLGSHDGTLMNGATFEAGYCEQAFSFDGVDDYVSIPSSSDFDLGTTDDKTFAFWWNVQSLATNTIPLSRRDLTLNQRGLALHLEPTDYYLHLEVSHWAKYTAGYTTNEWYHVALTKAGTSWKLYHDGSELSYYTSSGWPYNADVTKDVALWIGGDPVNSDHYFNGLIDEVAVYNRALTAPEILTLYQSSCHYCEVAVTPPPTRTATPTPEATASPVPPACLDNMIAYWQADGDASDYLGSHGGTLMNGATFGAGYCEQAFSCDGVDDYVSIPSSSDFNLGTTDDKTFAFWWNAQTLGAITIPLSRRDVTQDHLGLALHLTPTDYYLHLKISHWAKYYAGYTANEWYHVAVTKEGTSWKLYHNGSELSYYTSSGWPYNADVTKDVALWIGGDPVNSDHYFNGLIDEVTVYDRALTTPEVLALYQSSCHYCDLPRTSSPILSSGDYNGDGTSDIGIFRENIGLWAVRELTRIYFGKTGDLPICGDYDGNGTSDIGIFRAAAGLWAIRGITRSYFGANTDMAAPVTSTETEGAISVSSAVASGRCAG